MSTVHELLATDDTFREVADLLFGGGADDLIAKMNPAQSDLSTKRQKRERTEARIGLGSNVVGIAAGTAGLHEAHRGFKAAKFKAKTGQEMPEKVPKTKAGGKFKAFKGKYAVPVAAGAVGLQAANLAGDAIANRVLARSAKKEPDVKGGVPTAVRAANKKSKDTFGKGAAEIWNNASEVKGHLTKVPMPKKGSRKGDFHKKGGFRRLPNKVKTTNEVEKSADEVDVIWEGKIAKADSDKQQIFGWASVVELNGEPVVDLQGDYISTDEMEKAGYDYVMKSRKGGDMHLRDDWSPVQKSEMIESFIVTPEKRGAMGLPDSVPTGWWVGFQVQDPDVWAKVKSGERTGFSIHGRGKRTPA